MFKLGCKITITDSSDRVWHISQVSSIEITRDTEKLTASCVITLPKKIRWDGKREIPLRRGDKIVVQTGYDGRLERMFTGYIRDVGVKTPLTLTCEDAMYVLKQQKAEKKSYESVTIDRLLQEQGIPFAVRVMGEQSLGAYRVTADTVAELLGNLQELGVRCFFGEEAGEPVLYAGVLIDRETAGSMQHFGNGVQGNIIDDSLEQQSAESMRLRVTAISLQPDNKKIKVEAGDADGEVRTIHAYNKSEEELRAWAEQEVTRLKRDGLKGSFTTFGYKIVNMLDMVAITIDNVPKGVYRVQKNVIKYGTEGYRQEITIGPRCPG